MSQTLSLETQQQICQMLLARYTSHITQIAVQIDEAIDLSPETIEEEMIRLGAQPSDRESPMAIAQFLAQRSPAVFMHIANLWHERQKMLRNREEVRVTYRRLLEEHPDLAKPNDRNEPPGPTPATEAT